MSSADAIIADVQAYVAASVDFQTLEARLLALHSAISDGIGQTTSGPETAALLRVITSQVPGYPDLI